MIVPPDASLNIQAALVDLDRRLQQVEHNLHAGGVDQESITLSIDELRQRISRVGDKPTIPDPNELFVYSAKVTRSTNQSIATGVIDQVDYDAAAIDTGRMWVVSSPHLITLNASGWWLVGATVRWAIDATGTVRTLRMSKNNATSTPFIVDSRVPGAVVVDLAVVAYELLLAGDTIQTDVSHDAVGSVDILASSAFSPRMWALFVNRP